MKDSISNNPGIYGIKALVVACSAALLAGCGGGGSGGGTPGDGSDGGSNGGGTGPGDVSSAVPSDVDGLARLGNNYGLLYTQVLAGTDMAGLFMVSPEAPQAPELVDGEIGQAFFPGSILGMPTPATIGAGNYDSIFLTFHEGILDPAGRLAMMSPAEVFYGNGSITPADGIGYRRVSIDETGQAPTPVQVTDSESSNPILSRRILNDLTNAQDSYLLSQFGSNWQQLQLSDDENTGVKTLAAGLVPFSTVSDFAAMSGLGYLALDESDGSMKFVDADTLEARSGSIQDNTGNSVTSLDVATDLGLRTADGGIYLAASTDDVATSNQAGVWLYEYDATGPGTVTPVLSVSGEQLQVERGLIPPNPAVVPTDAHSTVLDGAPVFLRAVSSGDDGAVEVVRLDGSEWQVVATLEGSGFLGLENAFLLSAGNRLVVEHEGDVLSMRADGSDRRTLDTTSDLGGQSIETPILAASDQWIFYNRKQGIGGTESLAVALNVVTDERIDIPDWTWVGASGEGGVAPNARLAMQGITDVFMIGPNAELAAVGADDTAAGKVNFGPLPGSATEVRFFGIAPGPSRLAQKVASGEPNSYSVIYLDVTDPDSMRPVTVQPSDNAAQRPLDRF